MIASHCISFGKSHLIAFTLPGDARGIRFMTGVFPVCTTSVARVCENQPAVTAKVVEQYPLVSTAAAAACATHRQRVFLRGVCFYALDYIITYSLMPSKL